MQFSSSKDLQSKYEEKNFPFWSEFLDISALKRKS